MLRAHSLPEAYLYLRVVRCASCGRGPLIGADPLNEDDPAGTVTIETECAACHADTTMSFERLNHSAVDNDDRINPGEEPSRIIDVAQWITLSRVLISSAEEEPDKIRRRHLNLGAGQCLEEALKFYDDDNDLPPAEAFFSDETRRRLRESPAGFSRQRLIDARANLPYPTAGSQGASVGQTNPEYCWWRIPR